MLCVIRFMMGTACGFGQPAVQTYLAEISPSNWRFSMCVLTGMFWMIGELYGALLLTLDDPNLDNLHWRRLLRAGALPSCVGAILSAVYLEESGVWLSSRGKQLEAMRILDSMRHWNSRPQADVSIHFVEGIDTKPQKDHFSHIFGPDLRFSTLVSCFTCFTVNVIYFGSMYAFPQIIKGLHASTTPTLMLVYGSLWGVTGNLLSIPVGLYVDRRPSTTVVGTLLVLSILAMTVSGQHADDGRVSFLVGLAGIKVTNVVIVNIAYQYASEIYPTSSRASGTSVSLGCGKLGAIVAPLAYEQLLLSTGTWTTFFYMMAAMMTVTSILPFFLPFETRGMILKDSVQEIPDRTVSTATGIS